MSKATITYNKHEPRGLLWPHKLTTIKVFSLVYNGLLLICLAIINNLPLITLLGTIYAPFCKMTNSNVVL